MEKLDIKVCVCTECVMNGAMDIIESIDGLKEMFENNEDEYDTDIKINVTPVKCLGEPKHGNQSPRVSIDGQIFDNANNETIMAEIMNKIKKDRG